MTPLTFLEHLLDVVPLLAKLEILSTRMFRAVKQGEPAGRVIEGKLVVQP